MDAEQERLEKQEKQEKIKGILSAQIAEITSQGNSNSANLAELMKIVLSISENVKSVQANIDKISQDQKNNHMYLKVLLEANLCSTTTSLDAFASGSTKSIEPPAKQRAKSSKTIENNISIEAAAVTPTTPTIAPKKRAKASSVITETEFFKMQIKNSDFIQKLFALDNEYITKVFSTSSKINIEDMEQPDKIAAFAKYTAEKLATTLIAAIKKNEEFKKFITQEYNEYKSQQLINDGKGNLTEDV
jgi:hypothetical protein